MAIYYPEYQRVDVKKYPRKNNYILLWSPLYDAKGDIAGYEEFHMPPGGNPARYIAKGFLMSPPGKQTTMSKAAVAKARTTEAKRKLA